MSERRPPAPSGRAAPAAPDAELDGALVVDRMLARYAHATAIAPDVGLQDRVMSAIGAEPSPAPIVAAAAATRAHRWAAAIAALRDLWPVAWGGGRPWAVRMSAAAIVLAVAVGAGSVGGLAAAGAWNLLNQHRTPIVAPIASPSPAPSPALSAEPAPSSSPSFSAEPTRTPQPSPSAVPTRRPAPSPTHRPEPTPAPTHRQPAHTPSPTHHPEPPHIPSPTLHPEPAGGGHGGG